MRLKRPRLTIERLRTTVLIGGGLLVAAIGIFLGLGQWKLYRQLKDLPKRLGIDIQQQADGVNYTQSRKGKTLFRIHAARAVQMKATGKMLLHDVRIDLYGEDGSRTDTISGSEFVYDHSAGVAQAAGQVEIIVMRPGVKPAISQLIPGASRTTPQPLNQPGGKEVHVKTSGLTFDQNSGQATTSQRVDFALEQGSGTSIGATYDSAQGELVLDRDVELHVERDGEPIAIKASHAEFLRGQQTCHMLSAHAAYSGGIASIGDALMHFREDGSITHLDGSKGVDILTDNDSHMAAPRGNLDFDEANHPTRGLLEGGATIETTEPARHIKGTSPTIRLQFTGAGQLRQAHLEQGVVFNSEQESINARGARAEIRRSWQSQFADLTFVAAAAADRHPQEGARSSPTSKIEPQTIRGTGGVTLISETTAPAGRDRSSLIADSVVAQLAPGGELTSLTGIGHTSFDQRTAAGAHQSSSADHLEVLFVPSKPGAGQTGTPKHMGDDSQIASMVQTGSVVLVQDPAPRRAGGIDRAGGNDRAGGKDPDVRASQATKPGNSAPGNSAATAAQPVRAAADRADYDGTTEILHLTGSPQVRSGGLNMTANSVDFSKGTGDAFAHGNVKASWVAQPGAGTNLPGSSLLAGGGGESRSKENGPIHAIASEAEMRNSTQEVIFRAGASQSGGGVGAQPKLWQASNSVSAPLIVLNQTKQTLVAQSADAANPVRTVLLTNSAVNPASGTRSLTAETSRTRPAGSAKISGPSLIRIRSGDLHYSEGERVALLHAGVVGAVTVETSGRVGGRDGGRDGGREGEATIISDQAEVDFLPAGVHQAARRPDGSQPQPDADNADLAAVQPNKPDSPNNSIDKMTALGHVSIVWPDRKGSGDRLVYSGEQSTFTLTGSSSSPPRITDAARGTVTGSALIFHTRDDSVTVEGDGKKTLTETQAPKKRALH